MTVKIKAKYKDGFADGPEIGGLRFRRFRDHYGEVEVDVRRGDVWVTLGRDGRAALFHDNSTALRAIKRYARDQSLGLAGRYTTA